MLRKVVYIAAVLALAACGSNSDSTSRIRVSGRVAFTYSASVPVALSLRTVDVTGLIGDSVCDGVFADDYYFCDTPESAFLNAYFLTSFTLNFASPYTFYALTSSGDEGTVTVSSLGNLSAQRAMQLMSEGASADAAIDEAQLEISTALGGLDVENPQVVAAFETAISQEAATLGLANPLSLSNQLAVDFHADENFDGTDTTNPLKVESKSMNAQTWTNLGPLLQNALGNSSVTLNAAPPAPSGIPFFLIEPLVLSSTRDVIVGWSNAYADGYTLTVTPNGDGSGGQTFSTTDTSQLVSGLSPGVTYYVFLNAIVGSQSLPPIGGTSTFRVSLDAQ